MSNTFFAKGKLLLTGEYLVMEGAKSIVLPLKLGQNLIATHLPSDKNNFIYWKAYESGTLWFQSLIDKNTLDSVGYSDKEINSRVVKLLSQIKRLKPDFFDFTGSVDLNFNLNFNRCWGLGSSSTLINILSQWSGIDPYVLYNKVSNGSAYDIAASYADQPIFYKVQHKKPVITEAGFYPSFSRQLFFVYLGVKQSTDKEIELFKQEKRKYKKLVSIISEISEQVVACNSLIGFEQLMVEHENLLSRFLERPSIKDELFTDYDDGIIKSLGAWGGDFILMTCSHGRDYLEKYLSDKSLYVVFEFDKLVHYPETGSILNEFNRAVHKESYSK